ncbi:E3 ubiquitin ligase TRIM40 [Dugong dugon]
MVPLQEDSQEEGLCSICQGHLKEAVNTDCGHLFCRDCLAHYLKDCPPEAACPVCRAPCSEKVLGEGYVCQSHQERVSLFCEESCLLLCVKCQECLEHQSHRELTIEEAISHYKERLSRRSRKLRKDLGELQQLKAQEEEKLQTLQVGFSDSWEEQPQSCGNHQLEAELESQHQARGQLNALPQQQLDQLEDMPAVKARILAITQLGSLIDDLERSAKQLDANMLKP